MSAALISETSAPTRQELLIFTIAGLLTGCRHVAVGAASPIPGAAALLERARSGGALRVSLLGSTRNNFFTDGGVELFDCAAQGRVDAFFLGGGQIDGEGNVNVSRLSSRPHVTAGVGGFIDITAHARSIVFCGYFTAGGLDQEIEAGQLRIRKDGKSRKFVEQVEHVTFSGKRAREQKQEVLFVTERAVLKLEPEGLTVIEIAPGIDLERDVLKQADTALRVSPNLKVMEAKLFEPKRFGLQLKGRT